MDCQIPPKMRGLRRPYLKTKERSGEFYIRHRFSETWCTYSFHDIQSQESASEIHTAQDKLTDERVGDTDACEDGCAIVEAAY